MNSTSTEGLSLKDFKLNMQIGKGKRIATKQEDLLPSKLIDGERKLNLERRYSRKKYRLPEGSL